MTICLWHGGICELCICCFMAPLPPPCSTGNGIHSNERVQCTSGCLGLTELLVWARVQCCLQQKHDSDLPFEVWDTLHTKLNRSGPLTVSCDATACHVFIGV